MENFNYLEQLNSWESVFNFFFPNLKVDVKFVTIECNGNAISPSYKVGNAVACTYLYFNSSKKPHPQYGSYFEIITRTSYQQIPYFAFNWTWLKGKPIKM